MDRSLTFLKVQNYKEVLNEIYTNLVFSMEIYKEKIKEILAPEFFNRLRGYRGFEQLTKLSDDITKKLVGGPKIVFTPDSTSLRLRRSLGTGGILSSLFGAIVGLLSAILPLIT